MECEHVAQRIGFDAELHGLGCKQVAAFALRIRDRDVRQCQAAAEQVHLCVLEVEARCQQLLQKAAYEARSRAAALQHVPGAQHQRCDDGRSQD